MTLGPAGSLREGASGDGACTWFPTLGWEANILPSAAFLNWRCLWELVNLTFDFLWIERGFVKPPEYCWASFHRLVGHLCIFLDKRLSRSFDSLKIRLFLLWSCVKSLYTPERSPLSEI